MELTLGRLALSQAKATYYKEKVKEVLGNMDKIVQEYRNLNLSERVKYLIVSKDDLPGLATKLQQTTQDLTMFLTVHNGLATRQLGAMIERVLANQDEERQEC